MPRLLIMDKKRRVGRPSRKIVGGGPSLMRTCRGGKEAKNISSFARKRADPLGLYWEPVGNRLARIGVVGSLCKYLQPNVERGKRGGGDHVETSSAAPPWTKLGARGQRGGRSRRDGLQRVSRGGGERTGEKRGRYLALLNLKLNDEKSRDEDSQRRRKSCGWVQRRKRLRGGSGSFYVISAVPGYPFEKKEGEKKRGEKEGMKRASIFSEKYLFPRSPMACRETSLSQHKRREIQKN